MPPRSCYLVEVIFEASQTGYHLQICWRYGRGSVDYGYYGYVCLQKIYKQKKLSILKFITFLCYIWDVWSCLIQLKKSLEKIEAFPAQVPQRDRLVLGTFYGQWCHITSGSKLVLRLPKMMITDFLLSTTRWKCGDRKKRIIKVF